MASTRLAPRLRDRIASAIPGPGWRRMAMLRRLAAGLLAALALVLALAPPDGARGVPVLVAATDIAAGAPVGPADLAVRQWPDALVPAGALREPSAAEGRMLVGAARAGEPLTDVRLAGPAALGSRPDTAAVPVRLSDPGVAGLLTPGSRVDVVGLDEANGAPAVLASDAAVLAVLPAEDGPAGPARSRMILVGMPRELATRVAAAAVADQLAVTLR
jgi:pilus assembly protein CpaB